MVIKTLLKAGHDVIVGKTSCFIKHF
jgi:hypothetical protein